MATIIVIDENKSNLKGSYKAEKPRENLIKKGKINMWVSQLCLGCCCADKIGSS